MDSLNTLFLVPSEIELRLAENLQLDESSQVRQCGVGVVESALTTMQLLVELRPKQVVLLGIAGGYPDRASIDQVLSFSSVHLTDIGAGQGDDFVSLAEMDSSFCKLPSPMDNGTTGNHLLTVCQASGSSSHASRRMKRFPQCVAEDMEGFSVAAACQALSIRWSVVRGISNVAGDRDFKNWNIETAMTACVDFLNQNRDQLHG